LPKILFSDNTLMTNAGTRQRALNAIETAKMIQSGGVLHLAKKTCMSPALFLASQPEYSMLMLLLRAP